MRMKKFDWKLEREVRAIEHVLRTKSKMQKENIPPPDRY